jgi:hypothetical protein
LAIRCRGRPRCAHIPDYAVLAAADQVSARIAAVLDGEVGAEVVELHNRVETVIQA